MFAKALLNNSLAVAFALTTGPATAEILALLSDNPLHPPEIRPTSSLRIIGRVMWWGHTNRD